ncbi:MAG TPA: VCBS repeat-containing protein [Emcibacteraceae bacterium]|nr:VCBS repeat-containing protein [Emcibacteraceae bacterium]HRW29717.1 VCBS repeat-containing protein [Emcibacteraceae bacterium]
MISKLVKIILGVVILFLLVWQFAPSLILAPYNAMSPVTTTSTNGLYIINANDNEYVEGKSDIKFRHVKLDGEYNSEGASVADINNDGLNDVVTGHYWYEAPDWTRHVIRKPLKDAVSIPRLSDHIKIFFESGGKQDIWSKAYPLAFFTFHEDVNKDGWIDVIALDITSAGFYWFENPKGVDGEWPQHLIMNYTRNESPVFMDILGTGKPQVITGAAETDEASGKLYAVEFPDEGGYVIHTIEAENEGRNTGATLPTHGLGVGDINGDGLNDVVFGSGEGFFDKDGNPAPRQSFDEGGWYEQQIAADGTRTWKWHIIDPAVSFSQMLVMDINKDGRNDFMSGMGHGRGVFWFEQTGDNEWKRHVIDDTYTDAHADELADIDGDGVDDLVVGKTPLAHLGLKDPDEFGTPYLYWYKIVNSDDGKVRFERNLIDDSVGVGRQVTVSDINKDGLPDIAVATRHGVHIFLQEPAS